MNRWVMRGDDRYCERHERLFGKLETCSGCDRDPGLAPEVSPPEQEDKETLLEIARLDSLAKYLERKGRDLIDEGTYQDKGLALKFIDTSIKASRAAQDMRAPILDRKHDRWLVEQNRLLQGGVSHRGCGSTPSRHSSCLGRSC